MRMSEEEFRLFCAKTGQSPFNYQVPKQSKPSKSPKYRNKKVYVYKDGFVSTGEKLESHGKPKDIFDSVREYNRWCELVLMQKANLISNLSRQEVLVIQSAFERNGEKIRAIEYKADHSYTKNGQQIIEDVKGFNEREQRHINLTKDFKLKWKLLKQLYPNKIFQIY